ncbi:hypothetical protein BD560DRAFT_451787 [Blakeslea trispora]|nr:hypothetical protein BD560DRAFT_451787 [Blakeslea trispora]
MTKEQFWEKESVNEYLTFIQAKEDNEWPDDLLEDDRNLQLTDKQTQDSLLIEIAKESNPYSFQPELEDTMGMTKSYTITAVFERNHITNQLFLLVLFILCITIWILSQYKRWKVKQTIHLLPNSTETIEITCKQ